LFIPDTDPDFLPIRDLGVKKAPDPDPQHCPSEHSLPMFWSFLLYFFFTLYLGATPENEIQIYTWMDASLKEITGLVKEVNPDARK
jgi:hypothetical protein